MEIFVIQDSDDSLDNDELVTKLRDQCSSEKVELVSGSVGHWRSLEDWAASTCRSYQKLERKLTMCQDDFIVVTKLLLQSSCRQVTGDSDYLLSDLLELQNNIKKCRRQHKDPDAEEGVVGEAAKNYKKFLKQCGLVDNWELIKSCRDVLEENHEKVSLVLFQVQKSDVEMIASLSDQVTPVNIVNGSLVLSEQIPVTSVSSSESGSRQSVSDVTVLISSFLRLLLCTKEELSLARAVTSSGNDHKGCKKKFEDPKKNASFKSIDCEFNAKK